MKNDYLLSVIITILIIVVGITVYSTMIDKIQKHEEEVIEISPLGITNIQLIFVICGISIIILTTIWVYTEYRKKQNNIYNKHHSEIEE